MVKKWKNSSLTQSEQCHCVSYKLYTVDMYRYSITQCHELIPQKILWMVNIMLKYAQVKDEWWFFRSYLIFQLYHLGSWTK